MVEKPIVCAAAARDVDDSRCRWLEENALAFAAQADWHARHPHPLAQILIDPKSSK